jgi:hypothetical protein
MTPSATSTATFVLNPVVNSAEASFEKIDAATQGNWKDSYGADGGWIPSQASHPPAYAELANSTQGYTQWARSTSDVRGLQKWGPSGRVASAWTDPETLVARLTFADKQPRRLALYCVDWKREGLAQTIEILDAASGASLDKQEAVDLQFGKDFVWTVRGNIDIRVTRRNGSAALLSGIFLGTTPPAAPAAFVKMDATTQGNWKGAYGSAGYHIIGNAFSFPSAVQVAPSGKGDYTWTESTSDVRALQKSASVGRVASCWYGDTFRIDLSLAGGKAYRVGIYCVDWDRVGRSQRIDVIEPVSGALLDTRTLASFQEGKYLVWELSGRARIEVTKLAGPNAVVMGLFFETTPALASSRPAQPLVHLDAASQNAHGDFQLRVSGRTGEKFVIETSVDLIDWIGARTNVLEAEMMEWQDVNPRMPGGLFYRVVPLSE